MINSYETDTALKEREIDISVEDDFVQKPFYDFFKRIFDIVCSLLALIVLSPVFLVTSAAIMIDDFGNPFFTQKRVGYHQKLFTIIKFRSMEKSAERKRMDLDNLNEADGPVFKITEDPRITRVGKFIRKYSIDELPQLVNVLTGSMSIIGPRPFVVYEQEKFDNYQNRRHLVKPGLSCYAALEGEKVHEDFDYWIELDMKYIRERSFATDLKIIFKTIGVVLKKKNC